MTKTFFQGETYNDDRMFLLYLCQCTSEERGDGIVASTIYHERESTGRQWCIVTFRNTPRYPATRIDHFGSFEEAQEYFEREFPSVPLISLGGRSPRLPMSYPAFREWELAKAFADYDYRKVFSPDGRDAREIILTRKT
jgi:hypothetical protein